MCEALGPAYEILEEGARAGVMHAIRGIESSLFLMPARDPNTEDGRVRMSAALMDSEDAVFSLYINIYDVEHPIDVAHHLRDNPTMFSRGAKPRNMREERDLAFMTPLRWPGLLNTGRLFVQG